MTDLPILFSGPMVRALLEDRKTQTRRSLKFQPAPGISIVRKTIRPIDATPYHAFERRSVYGNYAGELDIRIKRGDRLWVREAWRCNGWATDVATIFYRASEGDGYTAMCEQYPVAGKAYLRPTASWRPSIHMPRWASRLTLIVTDVRVERLQDISEADAKAEGIDDRDVVCGYSELWDQINGNGAWEANPWVVAYTFRVIKANIDAGAA